MPTTIEDVKARQILDSRGNPTVEVDVTLSMRRCRTRSCTFRRFNRYF